MYYNSSNFKTNVFQLVQEMNRVLPLVYDTNVLINPALVIAQHNTIPPSDANAL